MYPSGLSTKMQRFFGREHPPETIELKEQKKPVWCAKIRVGKDTVSKLRTRPEIDERFHEALRDNKCYFDLAKKVGLYFGWKGDDPDYIYHEFETFDHPVKGPSLEMAEETMRNFQNSTTLSPSHLPSTFPTIDPTNLTKHTQSKMHWYAVIDSSYTDEETSTCMDGYSDRYKRVKAALERAEQGLYTIIKKDNPGLGGMDALGDKDTWVVELYQGLPKLSRPSKKYADPMVLTALKECLEQEERAISWIKE
ncbi:hypothetical protein BDV28DRAFT_146313 [Aspergillus coremiiformis]|uniref:Uncharacterized protein n=1 Tax=Aspergillus coremiiformis TaxID=138285 RepID=A0A5N6ZGI0_9EURO|nr:hypothetical protein BDV28DRAFT_146313 [Aspergillus coremiiformis]